MSKISRPACGLKQLVPAAACLIAGLWMAPAFAQSIATGPDAAAESPEICPGFWTAFWTRNSLFGQACGLRTFLGNYGISITAQEVSEAMGNVTGGIKLGATYDGLTTLTLQLDTKRAFDWEGGTFNASALQIHGRSLSANYLANLQTVSGIEADRATRLWELWYQQSFFDGRADVKLGQQSLDQEFIVSTNALLFVNTMFGWPMVPSADLPSGGPAYPLSSPGVRLRGEPVGPLTLLAGVFDDNPAGPGSGDPQLRDASGTSFRTSDGALIIAEAQYAINQPSLGDMAYNAEIGLPGTYKIGAWYDTGDFADQEIDDTGLSLASLFSSGNPRIHHGDYSLYAVMDQMIWRPSAESPRSLNIFGRAMAAPEDQNSIDFSLNAGLTLKDPLPGRDNDTAGIGMGYARVSGRASAFDRDTGFFNGTHFPVRSGETFIEVTYQYQLAGWWQLQPDLQYVFNPGGGVLNPNNASKRIGNELVLGLRTIISF
jgi:porin